MVVKISGNTWTEGGLRAALRESLLRGQQPAEEIEMALRVLGTRGENLRLHVINDVRAAEAKRLRRPKSSRGDSREGRPGTGLSRFRGRQAA